MTTEEVYQIARSIADQLNKDYQQSLIAAAYLNSGKVSIRLAPALLENALLEN